MYKKQVLYSATEEDVLLFHKLPNSFHTFLPVVNDLKYAATLENQCSLLQLVLTASWITIVFL
jgi:hypothetical protein